MNNYGIIRRVDELGRIVIPVEIRKLFSIKEGELLEFIIRDGFIELRKKSLFDNHKDLYELVGNKLDEVFDDGTIYFISDRNKIIKSNNKSIEGLKIDNKMINLLNVHDISIFNNETLVFDGNNIKNNFHIYPYYTNGDIAGFIVLYNVNVIEKYSKLLKFLILYMNDSLSL